ncbi:FprA family A-type flavoprotein [Papillibacter cinnamivorans]|uniref:Flavorubredoxin n=1 Tax=Papillibacter cinnamivorans DSM 12816 TaxID=1122930 RepID=A0A1W2A646_9FIRM|nr:FprA family A-type flavoprotein [Papillibacter cinnamivorans]SMC56043.1 Flavorubredoxin [Papillibacter cinnamivorans DSM 12816]
MYCVQEIAPRVFWVGGSDRRLERFENMFPLPGGVSYNAYLILDEKTALFDTVDSSVADLYLENVAHVLDGRKLDYLVISHMEPDHSAVIAEILRRYPEVQVVGNQKTFQLLGQFFTPELGKNRLVVQENQELSLGESLLRFTFAPMVHWPEVIFTWEATRGILFSADAFGSFGALAGNLFADEVDITDGYLDEARRYYANIVGRYGVQVQSAMKKLAGRDIRMICPLHGLLWRKDLPCILEKYDLWSRYEPEKKGVALFYGSMYGNTENAASVLCNKLAQRGVTDMRMYDVSKTHPSYLISDAWKYSHLVFASPTYNLHLYFPMETLLQDMGVLGLKNRKVAVLGCHSWASAAAKRMEELLSAMKEMELLTPPMDIRSSLKPEGEADMDALADAIAASLSGK